MTALFAVRLDGFMVLGADQLQAVQREVGGRILETRIHRKVLVSDNPQFILATGGVGSLDRVRVTAETAPTMKPSSAYVAELVQSELRRSTGIDPAAGLEIARELQALLRGHLEAQDSRIRDAVHRLNTFVGYKHDDEAQFLQFEVLNTTDVKARDIHLNDTSCSFCPESLRTYFQDLPALPDRRLETVIEYVRSILLGAIDQEQRQHGDQASVGGGIDVAIIDRHGAKLA